KAAETVHLGQAVGDHELWSEVDRAAPRWDGGVEINLINEDSRVHTLRKLADHSQVCLFSQCAARVVQVGDDDQARAVGHCGFDCSRIEAECVRGLALEP